ncbi:gluconokinase [Arthrobacter sp.]|uniref:gluconokinase n=1 Tax=Arthrobacter sp. TaxID=1667 RepID=UPI00289760B4|nr:gluconokinase [Arthrobacter sp.]
MNLPSQHLVIMGVAGSGKTTTATLLSEHLGWIAAEADEFHSAANIEKMSSGVPLADEDRWPWLTSITEWMSTQAQNGRCTIITCSALKRSYRQVLAQAEGQVHFVHLHGEPEVLAERMQSRRGHFMPASLLPSQLSTLEPLEDDESGITVDILRTPAQISAEILDRLLLPSP